MSKTAKSLCAFALALVILSSLMLPASAEDIAKGDELCALPLAPAEMSMDAAQGNEDVGGDSAVARRSREGAVSKSVIEQIYENHANDMAAAQNVEGKGVLDADAIYDELGRLYLKIEQAEKDYQTAQSEKTEEILHSLIERKDLLENQLTSLGHIFLTQEEVDKVFGDTDVSPLLDTPTKPANTKNHRFALSPTYSTTANGKTVKFYYVTATPLTTSSTMHESYNIDIMENGYAKKFIGALVEVYASKITAAAIAAVSVPLSWAPYEMLSYTPNSTARSDYQIRASFTSTPRFVWAGYEDDFMYYREGSFHSTSVSEVHTIVSVMNGKTITDTEQKDFTETTEHYTYSEIKAFVRWQYEEGSVMVLEKNKFEYYFEDEDGNRTECASQVAPYAADYSYLN